MNGSGRHRTGLGDIVPNPPEGAISDPAGCAARSTLPRDGLLLLAAITFLWGVNWPMTKLAVSEVPVWTFRTICLAIAGVGLLAIARTGGLSLRVPRREFRFILLVSLFNVTGWQLCSAFGLLYMPAGRASILALTMPLWATLLAVPVLGERLTRTTVCGLGLGLGGLGVLVLPEWRQIAAQPIGVAFMLGAAVSWAVGTVAFKYFRWTTPVSVLTGWQLLLGGVPVAVGALIFDAEFAPAGVSATAWMATLFTALLPMLFCQWAWFKAAARYPTAIASIGVVAIPAVGVFSGALILDEPIGWDVLMSLVLVSGALATVLIRPVLRGTRAVRNVA